MIRRLVCAAALGALAWTSAAGLSAAAPGPIWRVTIEAMSDQTRIFRAVPVTAP